MHNLHANLDSCAADNVKVWSCVICGQADETLGYLQIITYLSLSMYLVHILFVCSYVVVCVFVCVCVCGGGSLMPLRGSLSWWRDTDCRFPVNPLRRITGTGSQTFHWWPPEALVSCRSVTLIMQTSTYAKPRRADGACSFFGGVEFTRHFQ